MMMYLSIIETQEDRSKFIQIYETYRGLMFYIANERLHNQEDAEDAVHEAFIRIAEGIQDIDASTPERTKGLVTMIANRCAIDLFRKRERRRELESQWKPDYEHPIETGSALADSLAKLPLNYRDIILLKCTYGYEMKQIAKFMNISEANAYKTFSRAKRKFERICIEDGIL